MDEEPKSRWKSIIPLALIGLAVAAYFYNKPGAEPETSLPSTAAASNTSLEAAKDMALNTPNCSSYINLGLEYYRAGQTQNCVNITLQALTFPDTAGKQALIYNNLCAAYNSLQMPDSAIKAGERALQLQPDFQLAINNLRCAQAAKGK